MPDKSELGKRIKKVREDRHMTLKNIEAVAGISATHISEIERGKTSPTLGALIRIAKALGKDPAYFIETEDLTDTSTVTIENRIQESLPDGAGMFERLTSSIPGGRLQGCLITLNPGGSYPSRLETHHGNEAVLVISGAVSFEFDGEMHELSAGDSAHYEAQTTHRWMNRSTDEPVRLLWFCTDRSVS